MNKLTARNTTTEKKESKTKGTRTSRAKDEQSKLPAKRGRPRKVKAQDFEEEEPKETENSIDETGVKIYDPKAQDEVPENDTPFAFESEEAASQQSEPVNEQSVPEETEPSPFDSVAVEETAPFVSADDSPFSRAFEPVSSISDDSSATEESTSSSFSSSYDDSRDVEFELAQERVDSTMKTLVESQRTFFNTNQTRDVNFRILQLKKLYRAIKDNEALITEALYKDLSKSPAETYSTEIGLVLHEISYVIKHLKKWTKPRRKIADLHLLPARFIIYTEPLGVSLVMSTWN